MNIGNALESPKGVDWDVKMDKQYFDIIKSAGFDSVRIPVRFSDYAKDNPDYQLEEDFMLEVDKHIDYALALEMTVILDLHHFVEIMEYPLDYRDCFFAIWQQLSERYKGYPPELIFELLNEPQKNLEGELWNDILAAAVNIIRDENPDRYLIIGPDNYNSLHRLSALELPDDDKIIVSIHYYSPTKFTFQGDPYHEGYEDISGTPWGKPSEIIRLRDDFKKAYEWAEENNKNIFLGEFGVNRSVPDFYRMLWIRSVRKYAERMGFAWGYWEFCSNFGIYDLENNEWNEQLLKSLID